MNRILFLLVFFSLFSSFLPRAYATHNRAGEITYVQIGPNTIEAKITTYTKISGQSIHADRDELTLTWGDGTSEVVPRSNGGGVLVVPDIQRNEYIATHTYPGPNPVNPNTGQFTPYIISMEDPNRNQGILNVANGGSVDIPFFLQTEVFLFNAANFGVNSSPILLEPPVDFGVLGEVFQHTPNGYDPDGDSVAYELVSPLQAVNTPVLNYQPVSSINAGPNNQFTFDQETGLFTWTTPQRVGEYNIAILVKSYRNGLYLGGILRDIQIEIRQGNNTPPIIEAPEEICVFAGEVIDFEVLSYDPDGHDLELTATGGPLLYNNSPATFTDVSGDSVVTSQFYWETTCDHIQRAPHQIVFKARDFVNAGSPTNDRSLATFKVLRIRVIAPPVENLQAEVLSGDVTISFDAPHPCEGSDGFLGFSIWRKEGCAPVNPDSCDIGIAGLGYTLLAGYLQPSDLLLQNGRYIFIDENIDRGKEYSYRILAQFGTPSFDGNGDIINIFDEVPSALSEEACLQTSQDIPLLLNVDVLTTDAANGEIFLRWTRPIAEDLDTLENPPPYTYELLRSEGQNGGNFGAAVFSATAASYSQATDTSFTDLGLNTLDNSYSYTLRFSSNNEVLGEATLASSVFLSVASTDATNNLSWTANVPWTNNSFVVFNEQPTGSGNFVVLDTVTNATYSHQGLTNAEEYCYYVESIGSYNLSQTPDSLFNKSQRACGVPLDTVAPCPPVAIVGLAGCEEADISTPASDLFNEIAWQNAPDSCASDVAAFRVYFAPLCNGNYELIAASNSLNDTFIFHQPALNNLAGCYYITSVDSVEVNGGGNESLPSGVVSVDNCPVYELPNVFSPNGDGDNDLFVPFRPYRYIASVEFEVYNRWGQRVFSTTNMDLEWDGTDETTGEPVAEGVYYYVCVVNERRLNGIQPRPLKGYIHVIR